MTGTFGSLNIAKSGLQYQQIAIDVADNNISNVNTTGYVRESAESGEIGGASAATMWSSYPGYGEGVQSEGVSRLSDVLLGARQRVEHGTQSLLEVQQASMSRFETAIGEPGDDGVSAALSDFSSSLQDLANTPDGSAARQAVVAKAGTLTAAIQAQARNLADEVSEQQSGAATDVSQINATAQDVAALNRSIFIGTQSGNDVNDLQDQRDQDVLQLAQLAGATTTVQSDGRYDVSINGVSLVSGDTASALAITSTASGTVGDSTLAFQMQDQSGNVIADPVPVTSGDLGGIAVLLNTSLPSYYQGLNQVAYNLASTVNTQHEQGYDANGDAGTGLFSAGGTTPDASTTYDPDTDYAGTIAVAITDPSLVAASSVAGTANLDATNADQLSTAAASVADQYQSLVTGLGVQVSALNAQTTNQQSLTTQIDDQWQQGAGVSLDEETINLMAAQQAYEASAKVLSVMDSVLDTLINNTVGS